MFQYINTQLFLFRLHRKRSHCSNISNSFFSDNCRLSNLKPSNKYQFLFDYEPLNCNLYKFSLERQKDFENQAFRSDLSFKIYSNMQIWPELERSLRVSSIPTPSNFRHWSVRSQRQPSDRSVSGRQQKEKRDNRSSVDNKHLNQLRNKPRHNFWITSSMNDFVLTCDVNRDLGFKNKERLKNQSLKTYKDQTKNSKCGP